MASSIQIKSDCSLRYQPNLGEEVTEVQFETGAELQVLQTWAGAWLAKDGEGRLFNVKKELAEEC